MPKVKRPSGTHLIDNNVYHQHDAFMVMAEGLEQEEEIETNAVRNGLDGESDDQMGPLLAMMRIMQEQVSEMDRKLQERINPKKSSDGAQIWNKI